MDYSVIANDTVSFSQVLSRTLVKFATETIKVRHVAPTLTHSDLLFYEQPVLNGLYIVEKFTLSISPKKFQDRIKLSDRGKFFISFNHNI